MSDAKDWSGMPMLGFDVETTGTDVWDDRIVTAALIAYPGLDSSPRTYSYLLDPGVEIPAEATAIHGITTDHARQHGRSPSDVLPEIIGTIALAMHRGIPVVAANASFDLTILEVNARRHGESLVGRRGATSKIAPVIDPMILDKKGDPFRKVKGGCKCGCGAENKTLTGLCLHYGVSLGDDAHEAVADARAACLLWPKILERHRNVFRSDSLTIGSLHQAQIGWRREQMDSLRAYFDKNGTEHDGCDGSWPLLTPPAGALAAIVDAGAA